MLTRYDSLKGADRLVVTGVSVSSVEEEAKYLDRPTTDYTHTQVPG